MPSPSQRRQDLRNYSPTLKRTLEKLGVKPEKAIFGGCDLAQEIVVANTVKMTTVRMRFGAQQAVGTRASEEKPTLEVSKVSIVLEIVRHSD